MSTFLHSAVDILTDTRVTNQELAVFYKNEVERPTNQRQIFACGIWMSQQVLGKHINQDYLKWDIYLWESHIFYQKLLFGGKTSHLKITRTYLLIAYYIFLLAKHLQVFNECWDFSGPSEITLFPSLYLSISGQPNHKQNLKHHLSMAKVETALAAEFSICDLAELSWCSMTKSQVGEDLHSGPGPGILLGQQSTRGTKLKEALTLRCLPCMYGTP